MAVRLECTTGGHNKFWTIEIENEIETVVKYGAIGAKERISHKDHADAEKAKIFMDKQMKSKIKEGYVVQEGGESKAEAVEPPAKKPKVDSSAGFIRLEYANGGVKTKFWWIKIDGSDTEVGYGSMYPTEAKAKLSKKSHKGPAEARKFMVGMVAKKKAETYEDINPPPPADPDAVQLHVFGGKVSAFELEKRRDDWEGPDGEDDMCREDAQHASMDTAPEVAKNIAEQMRAEMPNLEDIALVGGSEGSDGGEVIVISGGSDDPMGSCIAALKIRKEHIEAMTKLAKCTTVGTDGYNMARNAEGEEAAEIKKGKSIMYNCLDRRFEFSFDKVVTAPVIFGGFTKDGSIVGVLTSRVYT